MEKHFRGSPELRKQINTSQVHHEFLPKQIYLIEVITLTERKIFKRNSFTYDDKKYK